MDTVRGNDDVGFELPVLKLHNRASTLRADMDEPPIQMQSIGP
jgi:hypothetical protein